MNNVINWVLRLIPAVIVGRAALMKFTGHQGAVDLFNDIEMGPGGRILIGVIEVISVALLLSPRLSGWGALLCLGVMTGAVLAHVTVIGFDGLMAMAIISGLASAALLYRLRHQVPFIKSMFDA